MTIYMSERRMKEDFVSLLSNYCSRLGIYSSPQRALLLESHESLGSKWTISYRLEQYRKRIGMKLNTNLKLRVELVSRNLRQHRPVMEFLRTNTKIILHSLHYNLIFFYVKRSLPVSSRRQLQEIQIDSSPLEPPRLFQTHFILQLMPTFKYKYKYNKLYTKLFTKF